MQPAVDRRRRDKNNKARTSDMNSRDRDNRIMILLRRQKGLCRWCDKPFVTAPYNDPLYWSLDHIIPRKQGGGNDLANLVLAHRICNETRSNPPLGRRRVASDDEVSP